MLNRASTVLVISMSALTAGAPIGASAEDAVPFYQGKQITFIVGTAAGGGNDLYARVLAQFMPRYIPGRPVMVVQNMPGSDGATAAAHVYNIAAKDGTVIATSPSSMLLAESLSASKARFDSRKFAWIGTISPMTDVLAVFKTTGINTLQDAKAQEVVIGATGSFALSSLEPAVANALLGTRFRIVKGYTGGDMMNVAMERHEIEGRTNQWASWKALRPEWIKDKKLSYLLQYGPREPELASEDVPTLGELVKDPQDKAIVDLLEIAQYVGRSVFAPPDMAGERTAVLQDAFDRTMRDAEFINRMKALNLDLNPRRASEIRTELTRAMTNTDAVVRTLKEKLKLN
jgi:tripartite-type tricarboxylate transporter receptor subunit TctC